MSVYIELSGTNPDVKSSETPISHVDIQEKISEFNTRVQSAHKANNDSDGNCLLINPKVPGYANMICKLYSDGSVTFKLGGSDYSRPYGNNEINGGVDGEALVNSRRLGFQFVLDNKSTCSTYVILPATQIIEFRNEMKQIIQLAETTEYFKPIDTIGLVQALNEKVAQTHKSHCDESGKNLLTKERDVYRLYSDGEITWTEGSRSPHPQAQSISGSRKYPFDFVFEQETAYDNFTFAVLTHDECNYFRSEMQRLILLFSNSTK